MASPLLCRFCQFKELDPQATWCPNCGLLNPVEKTLRRGVKLTSFDLVQTPNGGEKRFFVCQNDACNWPVMSPEEASVQKQAIKTKLKDEFTAGKSLRDLLFDGVKFFLTGGPDKSLLYNATIAWHSTFRCPNCRRPVFYRKSSKHLQPEEAFDRFAGAVYRFVIWGSCMLALFIFVGLPLYFSLLPLSSGLIGIFGVIITFASSLLVIVPTIAIVGFIGIRLTFLRAIERAQDQ